MIRNRLKSIRHRLEIDRQADFAELLGATRQQVNDWETHRKEPSLDTAFKLWAALKPRLPDINLQDLFEPPITCMENYMQKLLTFCLTGNIFRLEIAQGAINKGQ